MATHPAIGGFLRLKHCRTSPCGIAQSGMSPEGSLSPIKQFFTLDDDEFQWAVARMVTCFQNSYFSAAHPLSRFTHFEHCRTRPCRIARSDMLPGWSLSLNSIFGDVDDH